MKQWNRFLQEAIILSIVFDNFEYIEGAYVIEYNFSDIVSASTVTADNFSVTDSENGRKINIKNVCYIPYKNSVEIYLDKVYSASALYTLKTQGLKDINNTEADIYGLSDSYLLNSDDFNTVSVIKTEMYHNEERIFTVGEYDNFKVVSVISNSTGEKCDNIQVKLL